MTRTADRFAGREWTVTILPLPKRTSLALPNGFGGGGVLGTASSARGHRDKGFFWRDGAPLAIAPARIEAWVSRGDRDAFAGAWLTPSRGPRAALWRVADGGFDTADLHPPAYANSRALACAAGAAVGYGEPGGQTGVGRRERALLWHGAPDAVIELAGPDPSRTTLATGLDGEVQVGVYGANWSRHAALWRGRSETMVDLHPQPPSGHPPELQISAAAGAGSGEQIGMVAWKKDAVAPPAVRAALWRGHADSFVDLTPDGVASAEAKACLDGVQVGQVVSGEGARARTHAALWTGSASSFADLHAFVPAPWTDSWAVDIERVGTVVRVLGGVLDQAEEDGQVTTRARRIAVWQVEGES